jgi:hypothetical protein
MARIVDGQVYRLGHWEQMKMQGALMKMVDDANICEGCKSGDGCYDDSTCQTDAAAIIHALAELFASNGTVDVVRYPEAD